MRDNKNIIKDNNRADYKVVKQQSFYATIEVKSKGKDGASVVKTLVATHVGTRLECKNTLYKFANYIGGEVSYFGGFKK